MQILFNSLLLFPLIAIACSEDTSKVDLPLKSANAKAATKQNIETAAVETYAEQDFNYASLTVELSKALVASGMTQLQANSVAGQGSTYKTEGDNFAADATNFLNGVMAGIFKSELNLPHTDAVINVIGESVGGCINKLGTEGGLTKDEILDVIKTAAAGVKAEIPAENVTSISPQILTAMMKGVSTRQFALLLRSDDDAGDNRDF